MKNRTIIGIVCMILAVAMTFAIAPVVNRLTSGTTTVVRLKQEVGRGTKITEDQVETVKVKTDNSDFWSADSDMLDQYYYYDIDYGADRYFNSTYHRVQLGERMWVEISKHTYIKGLGVFKIPVTVSVKKSGLSEKYWK